MPSFLVPQIPALGGSVELPRDEARHFLRALRGRAGDEIQLLDGKGCVARALTRMGAGRDEVMAEITSRQQALPPRMKLHLYVAPPANSLLTQILKQAVELGVWRIVLLDCERSVSRPTDKTADDYEPDLVAALKQSGNPWLPEIVPLIAFDKALAAAPAHSYYGAGPEENSAVENLGEIYGDLALFVGPEGGFSDKEIAALKARGVDGLCVGRHVLRTETACTALISVLSRSAPH